MDNIVVVLGRNYTSRLGMIRAAGKIGCKVAVIKTDKDEKTAGKKCKIDSSSKYVEQYFCIKEPDEKGLVELLLREFSGKSDKVILLPTDDYTAAVIDTHQDELKDYFLYPNICEKNGEIVRCMDKDLQKEIAQEVDLPVAKGWVAEFVNDKYIIPEDVEFPCFIKPQISVKGNKHFMKKCDSMEDLENALMKVPNQSQCPVLIEQYINIENEYAILGFCDKKNVEIPAVIQMQTSYLGVTGTGKIIPIEEFGLLKDKLSKYMERLEFTGVFDIDLYESNGVLYFNELNLRFGASGYAITCAGINMPEMLIKTLVDKRIKIESNRTITSGTFANEKVCLQRYAVGEITWREFLEYINSADITFVKDENDKQPFVYFMSKAILTLCKKWLKRQLKMIKK